MAFVIFADQLSTFVLWVSVLEAAAQSAPTAPPSDRSDREAHSSHHHTSCILRQVLRPRAKHLLLRGNWQQSRLSLAECAEYRLHAALRDTNRHGRRRLLLRKVAPFL